MELSANDKVFDETSTKRPSTSHENENEISLERIKSARLGIVVGKEIERTVSIEELKEMNEITGFLRISGLQNISSPEEAKKVAMINKKQIESLNLRWNLRWNSDSGYDDSNILECLQPNFNLKVLLIIGFPGSKLASWMSNPLFTHLFKISLYECTGCHSLPPFGELPSLKTLNIGRMTNISNVSALFCRSEENKILVAFPSLERLTLEEMPELEEWSGNGIRDGDFPHLRKLDIDDCPKLTLLPSLSHFRSLEEFELGDCPELTALPEGVLQSSLVCLAVGRCRKVCEQCLKDGGEDWLKKNKHIKYVTMDCFRYYLD